MNKLKALSQALVWLVLASCYCDDCSSSDVKYPAYANRSGGTVKIVAIAEVPEEYAEDYPSYEKLIANGDILYNEPTGEFCSGLCRLL